mgnify:CR=1 FL=1
MARAHLGIWAYIEIDTHYFSFTPKGNDRSSDDWSDWLFEGIQDTVGLKPI